MRKSINFKIEDIVDNSFEKDEKEHARKYVGEYVIKTMSYGQKNEAQFKAVTVNPNFPQASTIDAWKFRFHSLLFSIESAPGFTRVHLSNPKKSKMLEDFIYYAPNTIGEKLSELSDEVNRFSDEEQKNSE